MGTRASDIDRILWHRLCVLVLLLMIGKVPLAIAQETPLWEAGFGIGTVSAPDYRGADQGRTFLLPIPYFVYYGERLNVDREGIRGEILGNARVSFRASASLGPPSNSTNEARSGMPDLDPTFEIGPSLDIDLNERADRDPSVTLRLPLRAVIASDFSHARYVGLVFLPNIALKVRDIGLGAGWKTTFSAGPIFATKKYHDYYYTVSPEFATPTRPVFEAPGGYSGAGVALVTSRRLDGYWIGGFLRYDYLGGAAFEDSPLVRTRHAFYFGIAVSKIIARSSDSARSHRGDP